MSDIKSFALRIPKDLYQSLELEALTLNTSVNRLIVGRLEDARGRLRQCACCEEWFYLLRSDQKFCSTACRRKAHSQSEAFKETRRKYMRDYRESCKEASNG